MFKGNSEFDFDAQSFWEKRLKRDFSLHGVGYIGLGKGLNFWMYRIRRVVFKNMVKSLSLDLENAAVFDMGAGTGFYVKIWKELRVRKLKGCDLTQEATSNLKQLFPEYEFVQMNVSDIPDDEHHSYDIISCMDVLFHVVEDKKLLDALMGIYQSLRPGGYFIFSDNFLSKEIFSHKHIKSRSLNFYKACLEELGFKIERRRAMFYLLNNPIDSDSKFLKMTWHILSSLVSRYNFLGYLIGAILYPVELILTSRYQGGPSTEIMLCRK